MVYKEIISIVTPSFNSKDFFYDTFKSVVSQTYSNFEWIIVDDCSTDGSLSFIQNIIAKDKRIKLLKTEKNEGSAKARNLGLKMACGRYITFLDSDDMLDNTYLEKQLAFIKSNGPIVTSAYRRLAKKTLTNFYPRQIISYQILLRGNDASCLTTMYDRKIIGNVYFPEDLKKEEDFIFWLKILEKGFVIKGNCEVLATYRITAGSKNGKKIKLIIPMFNVYHKYLKFGFLKSLLFVLYWGYYGWKKYKNVN